MSLYDLAVNPVRRLVNPAGCVAETADPGVRVPAAIAAATADPAAPAVPVATRLLRFQDRLTAEEVHARLRRALEAMHMAERSVFIWFSEIYERRLYRELGYSSIQAYASEELEFTINRVNRYLHLMNDLERLPLIRKALHAGELGWTKARAIVKVSSPANEECWLEAAKRLSRRDLESKVTLARIQMAARRRGDPAQPDLAPRSGQPSEKVLSEKTPSEKAVSGGLGAQAPESVALQSEDSAEAPVFRPAAGSPNEPLIDDGPVSVVFNFAPLDLARYEAQIEKIRKQKCIAPGTSREQILLRALEELIQLGNRQSGCQEKGNREGKAEGESTGAFEVESGQDPEALHAIVPRGTIASPYDIVIYKCDTCQAAVVQTQRGWLGVARAQLAAAECDAVISEPGKPNRSSIPPAVRRAVMIRDQHRCQAPGCRNTRFMEVHHIVPRECGGTNHPKNLVVLCSACHNLWHDKKLDGRLLNRVLELSQMIACDRGAADIEDRATSGARSTGAPWP